MPKVWEPRVGKLFHPEYFPWSFKPADSSKYGGQPRIDYLACDVYGRFWMVEVKQLREDRKSINIDLDVTIGQRNALDAVSEVGAVALLAVGCGSKLYVYTWERIRWLQAQGHWPRILLNDCSAIFHWTGSKDWTRLEMAKIFHQVPSLSASYGVLLGEEPTLPMPTPPTPTSNSPDPSPLTLKQTGYIRTLDGTGKVLSEHSYYMPENEATSLENSLHGGGKS